MSSRSEATDVNITFPVIPTPIGRKAGIKNLYVDQEQNGTPVFVSSVEASSHKLIIDAMHLV